jgi:hypothetical protein
MWNWKRGSRGTRWRAHLGRRTKVGRQSWSTPPVASSVTWGGGVPAARRREAEGLGFAGKEAVAFIGAEPEAFLGAHAQDRPAAGVWPRRRPLAWPNGPRRAWPPGWRARVGAVGPSGSTQTESIVFCSNLFFCETNYWKIKKLIKGTKNAPKTAKIPGKFPKID